MKYSSILLFLVLAVSGAVFSVSQVHASGTLSVDPPSVAKLSVGSNFNVTIKVKAMSTYNAWQMQIITDPSVINATGFSVNPSFPTGAGFFEAIHCVNGSGLGCTNSDGPGFVNSAATFLNPYYGPSNGVLFTINYLVVGPGPYSPIQITNDLISNGYASSSNLVPHVTVNSRYGSAADFEIAANPNSVTVGVDSSENTSIVASSISSFTGKISLSASTSEPSITLALKPATLSLSPEGYNSSTLSISTSENTALTSYSVTVRATNGTLVRSTSIQVGVTPNPYFVVGVSPGLLYIHAGDTSSTNVTIQSRFGYSGSVSLAAPISSPAGLQASFTQSAVSLQSGSSVNTTLIVVTPPSLLRFRYTVNITGSDGSESRLISLIIIPPLGEVSLQMNPGAFVLRPGESASALVTVSTHDYLWGTVDLSASMLGGTAKLNSTSVAFGPVGVTRGNFSLTLNVGSGTAPGTYTLTLTLYTLCFTPSFQANNCAKGDQTLSHSVSFNVVVLAPVLILGLAPLTYFGIVGVFAAGFAALAVQTLRKRRRE